MRNHGRFATAHVHIAPARGSEDSNLINLVYLNHLDISFVVYIYTEYEECLMYASWLFLHLFASLPCFFVGASEINAKWKASRRFLPRSNVGCCTGRYLLRQWSWTKMEQSLKRVSLWNAVYNCCFCSSFCAPHFLWQHSSTQCIWRRFQSSSWRDIQIRRSTPACASG